MIFNSPPPLVTLPVAPLSIFSAALAPVSPLSVIAVNGLLLEGVLTVRASQRPRLRTLQVRGLEWGGRGGGGHWGRGHSVA